MDLERLRRIYDECRWAAEQLEALRPQIDAADRLAAAQPRLNATILHAARISAEQQRLAAEQLEALRPQLDAADRLAAQIDDAYLQFVNERLDALLASLDEHRQIAEQFDDFSQRVLVAEQAARARNQLLVKKRKREEEVSRKLSDFGWYISPYMLDTPLETLVRSVNKAPEEILAAVIAYFDGQLDDIEQKLIRSHPQRKHLFEDAFEAHRDRKYNLSIPVFLSQADGIWWDRYSQNLFTRKGRKIVHEELTSSPTSHLISGFLYPLSTSTPLWMSEGERDASFNELNRHQVLHGESVEYGTEQNSLKAISLLNYLCFVLDEISLLHAE